MTLTTAQAREQITESVARSITHIEDAVQALGEAYEHLDERTADIMEAQLFKPAQSAYGRAKRLNASFAERHGLSVPDAVPAIHRLLPSDPRVAIQDAVESALQADDELAVLQDSMLPVEVGDVELRAGLAEIRELLEQIDTGSAQILRTIGR